MGIFVKIYLHEDEALKVDLQNERNFSRL